MASVQLRRESSMQESPRSPEAKVGMQVEDLWDTQEPQLSPNEKLNACFESIPVSAFPLAPQGTNFGFFFIFVHQIVHFIYMDPFIIAQELLAKKMINFDVLAKRVIFVMFNFLFFLS